MSIFGHWEKKPNRAERRALEADLRARNKLLPKVLTKVDLTAPGTPKLPSNLRSIWRNQKFLVQLFDEPTALRLSVNRTEAKGDRWVDGITWEELMTCKREAGFGDRWAYEAYPADFDVVDVANIRHLWFPKDGDLAFGWRKTRD